MILCSAERAEALGVPRDRWVFPHSGTDAHDHYFVSERDDLALVAGHPPGRAATPSTLAGVGVDDLAHVDLYSCFPSAVRDRGRRARARPRPAAHGHRRPVVRRRARGTTTSRTRSPRWPACCASDPGSARPVTANGGFITKHAFGVYCTEPPATPFRHAEPQAEVDALPRRVLCEEPDGEVAIETWTVMHDRDGQPETGIVVGLLADGRRALGTTTDADPLKALVTEELAGRRARVRPTAPPSCC